MTYQVHRSWSDKYIPLIRKTLGPALLQPSSFEQDTREAADLVILNGRDGSIAARVRRAGYDHYADEFTIRSKSRFGAPTEIDKLLGGFAGMFFYAHAAPVGIAFARWMLIDLKIWRELLLVKGRSDGWERFASTIRNHDGTEGLAFNINDFPTALMHRWSASVEQFEQAG